MNPLHLTGKQRITLEVLKSGPLSSARVAGRLNAALDSADDLYTVAKTSTRLRQMEDRGFVRRVELYGVIPIDWELTGLGRKALEHQDIVT